MRTSSIAVAVAIAVRAVASQPTDRFVHYADDRLTVHVEKMPLREVLAAVAEASGADVRGEPEGSDRPVTAAIDDLPLQEALERVLEKQPFSLRYDRSGHLKAIVLVQGSREAPASEQATAQAAPALAVTTALDRPLRVDGALADAIGGSDVPLQQVVDLAVRSDDVGLRSQAARRTLEALDTDAQLRAAFLERFASLSPDFVAGALRSTPNGEAFLRYLATNARADELRKRAAAIVEALPAPPR